MCALGLDVRGRECERVKLRYSPVQFKLKCNIKAREIFSTCSQFGSGAAHTIVVAIVFYTFYVNLINIYRFVYFIFFVFVGFVSQPPNGIFPNRETGESANACSRYARAHTRTMCRT